MELSHASSTEQVKTLMIDLQKLWSKVNIDQEFRENFVKNYPGIGPTAKDAVSIFCHLLESMWRILKTSDEFCF